MRRFTADDAGSRYVVTIPFARDLAETEREGVREALETAAFSSRGGYGDDPVDTVSVAVSAEAARVTVAVPVGGERPPGDVAGRLSRAVGEWHGREGPLAEPTRAGGETAVASTDAAALPADRDPPTPDAGPHTYALAYPERPLTDEEVRLAEHVTDDDAVVTPRFVALVDVASPVVGSPGRAALRDFRQRLAGHVPDDHDLRTRGFFPTCELGTLAAADDTTRDVLRQRGAQQTPHAGDSDAADSAGEV